MVEPGSNSDGEEWELMDAAIRQAEQIRAANPIPDIEDILKPRPRSSRGIFSVTRVTAAMWCQTQLALSLGRRVRVSTPAMQAGTARHEALEREVHGDPVAVEVESAEDAFALRLLGIYTSVASLMSCGICREMPLWGRLGGHWITGVIDELQLDCGSGGVRIVERKTRRSRSFPSIAQKDTAILQAFLYRELLATLPATLADVDVLMELWPCELDADLSASVRAAMAATDVSGSNLQALLKQVRNLVEQMPAISSIITVIYEMQDNGQHMWTEHIELNRAWMDRHIADHLAFLTGATAPSKPPIEEAFKCRWCAVRDLCPGIAGALQDDASLRA